MSALLLHIKSSSETFYVSVLQCNRSARKPINFRGRIFIKISQSSMLLNRPLIMSAVRGGTIANTVLHNMPMMLDSGRYLMELEIDSEDPSCRMLLEITLGSVPER